MLVQRVSSRLAARLCIRQPTTVRPRVPCMHSDLLTRVEKSANSHPDRPGVFARALELVISDLPPVAGDRTVDEEAAARLAQLEKKNADEQARRRGRKARAKAKHRLNEAMVRLNEAIHLISRLITLFQKPLSTVDALEWKSELDGLDSKLVQPMAAATLQMVQMLPDLATQWTAPTRPIVPRGPEADTDPCV